MKNLLDLRKDKNFNLEETTYQELFIGLKEGIVKAIAEYEKKEIEEKTICLDQKRCWEKFAYGEDGEMYPKILLDLKGNYSILLNPFKIEMLVYDYSVKTIKSEALDDALVKFMTSRFVGSDYLQYREKYLKGAEVIKRISDEMIII